MPDWDPAVDVPWSQGEDLDAFVFAPSAGAPYDLLADPAVWAGLSKPQRRRLGLELLDWRLSQLLHGERYARDVCRNLQDAAGIDARQSRMLAAQGADEDRHYQALALYRERVLGRRGRLRYPSWTSAVERAHRRESRWDMKLLGLQVILEWMALRSMASLRRLSRGPVLRRVLELVMRDEGRHLRHGMSLADRFRGLRGAELRDRQDFAFETLRAMTGVLPRSVWDDAGLPESDYRRACQAYAAGSAPRRRFAPLMRRFATLGLVSERLRPFYVGLGLL